MVRGDLVGLGLERFCHNYTQQHAATINIQGQLLQQALPSPDETLATAHALVSSARPTAQQKAAFVQ